MMRIFSVFMVFLFVGFQYGRCGESLHEEIPLPQTQEDGDYVRVKRQRQPDAGDQFFDNVFQIPISTLNAVNELIKSTRPVIRRARERIQQTYQTWQQQQAGSGGASSGSSSVNRVRPNRKITAGAGREQ